MDLKLVRNPSNEACTIGKLYVNGEFECFILEDVERECKVAGKTAIPAGKYKVAITMSPRFKKPLPLLYDVPNYSGVRIHPGNDADDTEGCLLPGQTNPTPYTVGSSGKAFEALMKKLRVAEALDETVWIEIQSAQ
jgi:hypothetical protein